MKNFVSLLAVAIFSFAAFAHDEGHGPKLSDTGKFGGLVSPVIKLTEADMGAKAGLVHKAEMARTADGTVRVYLYDKNMKPLEIEALKGFDKKASAKVATKVDGKWKETAFALELKDKVFVGKMKKPETKPYNIDFFLKEKGTDLLSAFDNLD